MARLRPYVARILSGSRPYVQRYPLKAGETFKRGDPVTIDSNEEVLAVSGADPTPILGLAAEDAEGVVETGFVLVHVANSDTVFAMKGDNAPTEDDLTQDYGIVADGDGIWGVDGTDISNVRVQVVDIDTEQELYFVKFLDAHRVINA